MASLPPQKEPIYIDKINYEPALQYVNNYYIVLTLNYWLRRVMKLLVRLRG